MVPRRRWRVVVVPLLGAWVAAVLALCLLAVRDLQRGADRLQSTRAELDLGEVADGSVADELRAAQASFEAARRRVTNPLMLPLRPLPVVGRHLRSVTALSRAATRVTATAERAVRSSSAVVRTPPHDGPERLATLTALRVVVGDARADLRTVPLGPDRALVGPLATRRREFADELGQVRQALAHADAALATAVDLLTGPRRYLLLVGSNAEMRAGSGAFLSVGVLEAADGSLHLGPTTAAGDLALAPGAGVPYVDADLEARWGWLEPNREWRNLGLSPRFPATAALAARMWQAGKGEGDGGGGAVDGVLALDAEAVRAIVAATGPVTVAGGRTFAADQVVPFLLHDQYVEAGAELGGRQLERRELLGELAAAAVDAIQSGGVAVPDLADELAGAVRGRHLLAWSADPSKQAGWAAAGVGGDLPRDALLLGVVNRGANKLDPFLSIDAHLSIEGGNASVRVELANHAPASGEPAYVAGPNAATGTAAGEYKGIVALTVPGFASAIAATGVSPLAVAGRDGETNVVGGEVRVPPGGSATVTVRFRLPAAARSLTVQPSARIPATTWTYRDERFTDVESRRVSW
jgi:HAMP domain-containing protein